MAGGAARRAAVLPAAALGCVAAVLLAGSLGPMTFSRDSPLDRLRLADRPGEAEPRGEEAVVEIDPPEAAADGDIPAEVVLSLGVVVVAGALLARSLLLAGRREDQDAEDEDDPEGVDGAPPAGDDPAALAAVAEAARRGLADLDRADLAATQAVLGCWVALEDAGGRLGSGRAWTDTPTDFARRLLAAAPALDPDVLDDLRRTYSRVRYGSTDGPGRAGPDDVRRARAALAHLLAVLDPRAAPAATGTTAATGTVRP